MAPSVTGYHHFAPTVSDVEASAQWYERVFGMTRLPVAFPHYGGEKGGYAVVLMEPRSGIVLGLHHHDTNPGQPFDERRTGLDHMSFSVAGRADLDAWAGWLDSLGVENSGVVDTGDPLPYSVVLFRIPITYSSSSSIWPGDKRGHTGISGPTNWKSRTYMPHEHSCG